ncbi:MAG: hypothetical protein CM1200mP2_58650 [Planctomycetaceae bacterium]|nr:MAG: hypothetical protein CM1200mP2_58650 [Planctomycetaceae bacterium]
MRSWCRTSEDSQPTACAVEGRLAVVRYGVATGIVQVVRPVVDVPRSGLLVPCPPFWAAGHEYPLRSEYSEHFVARNALGLINDQQVDQPIDQRKFLPRESAGRDLAVDSFGQKHFAGRVDVACVPVEAVNLVTGVDSQGSSEFPFCHSPGGRPGRLGPGIVQSKARLHRGRRRGTASWRPMQGCSRARRVCVSRWRGCANVVMVACSVRILVRG